MKNVKAVMCDIDGTLLSSNGIVTPKTIEAIKKLREHWDFIWYLYWKRCSKCQAFIKSVGN